MSAWDSMSAFVMALSCGAEEFFDGFRTVSFLIEAHDEDAD